MVLSMMPLQTQNHDQLQLVVDHDFEYDADGVDHDLDGVEPVSGGEDLLQHSVPLLADTPHLIVQVNNLKQGLTLYPGYPKLIIPNRGQNQDQAKYAVQHLSSSFRVGNPGG